MRTAIFPSTLSIMFLVFPLYCPVAAGEFPGERWTLATPAEAGLDAVKLNAARDAALTGGGSGYITRGDKLVMAWGDLQKRYDLKSTAKSFGATVLGLAVLDGKIALTDKVTQHHPTFGTPLLSNAATGWVGKITILHLATQTAGFEKPGGYTKLIFEPGWENSLGSLERAGTMARIGANLKQVADAAAARRGEPMEGADGPFDVVVSHHFWSGADLKKLDGWIAEVRDYERQFPYSRLRFATAFWPGENAPLIRPDGKKAHGKGGPGTTAISTNGWEPLLMFTW